MLNPRGEKFVARMLLGGISATLIGGFLFGLFFVAGLARMANTRGDVSELLLSGIGFLIAVGGIVMVIVGLVAGFKLSRGDSGTRGDRHLPEVFIASRFAINSVGEMIFSNFEFDAPGGKLYVQMRFPDGHTEEFKTAWGVFTQCGEGMRGAAIVKGSWLASFAPIMSKAEPLRDPDS